MLLHEYTKEMFLAEVQSQFSVRALRGSSGTGHLRSPTVSEYSTRRKQLYQVSAFTDSESPRKADRACMLARYL